MKNTIDILKALSDENRFRIVMMLMERPMCVCEISEILSIANSTLSAHLKNLKYTGIIDQKKDGRWIEYFIKEEKKLKKLLQEIENYITDKTKLINDKKKAKMITRDICSSK